MWAVVWFEFSFLPHPPHPMLLLGGFWSFAPLRAPHTRVMTMDTTRCAPPSCDIRCTRFRAHLSITVNAHMHVYTEDVRVFLHNLEFGRRRPLVNVVAFWDGTGATMCFINSPRLNTC